MNEDCAQNNDIEIYREKTGDYYSPSIHLTESGGIGINVGGYVLVAPVRMWHEAGQKIFCVNPKLPVWRRKLAFKLLGWKP